MRNKIEKIAILNTADAEAQAKKQDLRWPLVETAQEAELLLCRKASKWGIWIPHIFPEPYFVDFLSGAMDYRRRKGGGHQQEIAKAFSLSKDKPKILDLTAGWCKEAFLLASLGAEVMALEKNPLVYLCTHSALEVFFQESPVCRLQLQNKDSKDFLNQVSDWDSIYYDPMYPNKKKKALVKKDMQILQALAKDEVEDPELLRLAILKAKNRVVVKRPSWAEPILPNVSKQIESKNTRFDIYFV